VHKGEERWTWQFVRNPFGSRSEGLLPVWAAFDGGRVVGQIAVQDALLQVEEQTLEAGWIVDVMVLPGFRGHGLGHRLHDEVVRGVPILVTLTMARATRRIAEKAGCITLGPVHQLTRWVRLDAESVRRYLLARTVYHPRINALARFLCRRLLFHRALPIVVNPLLRLRDVVRRSRARPGPTVIEEVRSFGVEADRLWERTRRDYPVIVPRDSRFLNWRFVDCPTLSYRRFVARRGNETVGYLVLRRCEPEELPQGVIVDLYAARGDTTTIRDLVRHSIAFFGQEVAAIDCATSVPEYEAVLRRHGFFATRTALPTCVCTDAALRRRLEELKDQWFFSKGDHDWDQIHVA
jgi:GNAT superfamily N-acetyltransferase